MSTNINISVLPKLYEKNGSCIIDDGQLLYRVQVEHHNLCETSKVWWKGTSVEASSFFNSTNVRLNSFNGEHSILVVCEIMFQLHKTKNFINVLQVNVEFMASYPIVDFILS